MIFYTPLIKIKFCSIFLTKYSMHKTIKTVINNLQDFQILETQLSNPLLIFLSSMMISLFPHFKSA